MFMILSLTAGISLIPKAVSEIGQKKKPAVKMNWN